MGGSLFADLCEVLVVLCFVVMFVYLLFVALLPLVEPILDRFIKNNITGCELKQCFWKCKQMYLRNSNSL